MLRKFRGRDIASVDDVAIFKVRRRARIENERAAVDEPYRVGSAHRRRPRGALADLYHRRGDRHGNRGRDKIRMMDNVVGKKIHTGVTVQVRRANLGPCGRPRKRGAKYNSAVPPGMGGFDATVNVASEMCAA